MAPSGPVMDGVGVFWTAFASGWTALLVAGMTFLYCRRDMPLLRIRGLPLSFGAVFLLHLYWIAVQLGYVYSHLMPNGVEFEGRLAHVGTFPIGIEPGSFIEVCTDSKTSMHTAEMDGD